MSPVFYFMAFSTSAFKMQFFAAFWGIVSKLAV